MSNLDNQEGLWDHFQNEAPEQFAGALPRLKFLVNHINPPATVLDIGIGSGQLEQLAQAKGLDIYALDPVPKSIENLQARLNLSPEKAKVGYSQAIPFSDNTFDYVVATEVLEHLSDDVTEATLKEIRRVLKPGGVFMGTVPARENLQEQITVCPGCSLKFHRWGHQQSFTVDSMKALLSSEFPLVDVREELFLPLNIMNFKGKLVGAFKWLGFKLGIMGSNQNVFFRATKQ